MRTGTDLWQQAKHSTYLPNASPPIPQWHPLMLVSSSVLADGRLPHCAHLLGLPNPVPHALFWPPSWTQSDCRVEGAVRHLLQH